MWLEFLNIFFFIFHTAVVLFNVFGWLFRRFRKYNLILLLLTGFSWGFLGIWYGWGYCVCTDWHWSVRRQLGYLDQSNSYIDLLIIKLTGIDFSDLLVDQTTAWVFAISLIMSVMLNLQDYRRKKRKMSELR